MAKVPECTKAYYDNADLEVYTIQPGIILYSGARDTFPISKANSRLQNLAPDGTHLYKYFTPNLEVAKQFVKLGATNRTTKGYVGVYNVLKPIQILLNSLTKNRYSEPFYFNTKESYASPEAQCLCSDGFHGYASMTNSGLEDIGLCTELDSYLELVAYMPIKSNFTEKIALEGGARQSRRKRRLSRRLSLQHRRV